MKTCVVGSIRIGAPPCGVMLIEVVFKIFFALRKMSCSTPPAGALVGEIPVKVTGFVEALRRVIVATANCFLSIVEYTTTLTEVFVGKAAGAVNTPLLSMDPQFPVPVVVQEGELGVAVGLVAEPAVGWVTSQARLVGGVFGELAMNCSVCAGVRPTTTGAVNGLMESRIPESRRTVPVPVFLGLASADAVKVIVGKGLGNLSSGGAVYVRTFFVGSLKVP